MTPPTVQERMAHDDMLRWAKRKVPPPSKLAVEVARLLRIDRNEFWYTVNELEILVWRAQDFLKEPNDATRAELEKIMRYAQTRISQIYALRDKGKIL